MNFILKIVNMLFSTKISIWHMCCLFGNIMKMNSPTSVKPGIYDFTDYRLYLKALFEYEKSQGLFSYSIFAERAGFLSRSYLRTVISGKRNLTEPAMAKVIVGFNLNMTEAEAFRALVRANQAQTFKEKNYHWENFLKLQPCKSQKQIVDGYEYLSKMINPLLIVLLKQNHIKKDTAHLMKLTGLPKTEITSALDSLEKLGAIVKSDTDQYEATQFSFTTPGDVSNYAVQKYHATALDQAKEKLHLSPKEREFQSLTMALSEDEFKFLKKKIKNFMDEVEAMFSGPRPKSEKAYVINLNLVPTTSEFIRKDEKSASQNTDVSIFASKNEAQMKEKLL